MAQLEKGLPPEERVILAVDASTRDKALPLLSMARNAGAKYVKVGLEFILALGPEEASRMVKTQGLEWVADAKIHDIANTTGGAFSSLANLPHPPVGITMHATAGKSSLEKAHEIGAKTGILPIGVTVLTSIKDEEVRSTYNGISASELVMNLARKAVTAGVNGLVCSPEELPLIRADADTKDMFAMIPGIRPAWAETGDQSRITTPAQAIQDGADLLVIGRPIAEAPDPAAAYRAIVTEIAEALAA